jgi:hypothetical protein
MIVLYTNDNGEYSWIFRIMCELTISIRILLDILGYPLYLKTIVNTPVGY